MEAGAGLLFKAQAGERRWTGERERKERIALGEEREREAFLSAGGAGGFAKYDAVLEVQGNLP